VHPGAEDALLILLGFGPPEEELAPEELDEAAIIEQEYLDDIPEAWEEQEDDIPEDIPPHIKDEAPV
jgi:hypothetical protein